MSFGSFFTYLPPCESLINEGKLKHAVFVSIIVRKKDEACMPANIAYYLDPVHGEWLPYGLTLEEAGNQDMFFY